MNTLKRISILLLIGLLSFSAVFISYTGIKNGAVVFADSVDEWQSVNKQDLVNAFRAYCESRDLTIDGSKPDVTTSWTTRQFELWQEKTGIDITLLQAHIKKATDGQITQFLFDSTGISLMNRIFAQFLQDHNLSVGDTDVNEEVYSGRWFVDAQGNGCLVYVTNENFSSFTVPTVIGTPYKYTAEELLDTVRNNSPYSFTNQLTENYSYTDTVYFYSEASNKYCLSKSNSWSNYRNFALNKTYWWGKGDIAICYSTSTNALYYGYNFQQYLSQYPSTSEPNGRLTFYKLATIPTDTSTSATVSIVSNTINNNTYEGNTYTTINNEGDVNNYDTDDVPLPDSGGGGGGDTPDSPTPPSGNVNDWGVELPNLDIPWYLYGKEDKFPWNIPFNIMLTLSLLKADPQAPHFEGTMDFKFTTYDYDIDLSEFDSVATVMRKLEIVAFLIGLMVLTKRLIDW